MLYQGTASVCRLLCARNRRILAVFLFGLLFFHARLCAQDTGPGGSWVGAWSFSEKDLSLGCPLQGTGNLRLSLTADGATVSGGTADLQGFVCFDPTNCTAKGTSGGKLSLSPSGSGFGRLAFVASGTVSGGDCGGPISGSLSGSLANDKFSGQLAFTLTNASIVGTFSLHRQRPYKDTGKPSCERCCGDPIDLGSGNVFEQITDYETAGLPGPRLDRYYNSLCNPDAHRTLLGLHWRTSFDAYLRATTSSNKTVAMIAERPDGRELHFAAINGGWQADSDIDATLTQTGDQWQLLLPDDSVEIFRADGRPFSKALRSGYTQTFNYQGQVLTSVSDSFGRSLRFAYLGNALLLSVSGPDGLIVTYEHVFFAILNGNVIGEGEVLESVRYATTPETTEHYLYENSAFPYALTGLIDANGSRFTSWSYDNQGRAISNVRAGGANAVFVGYDNDNGETTVTNSLGGVTGYRFGYVQGLSKLIRIARQASTNVPAATFEESYDANGYLASVTDWNGNVTRYNNDSRGQPLGIIEAFGTPNARQTTHAYHSTFHLPIRTIEATRTTEFSYDAHGNLLSRKETDTSTNTVPYITARQTREWQFTYNALGQVLTHAGPRTDVPTVWTNILNNDGTISISLNPLGHVMRFPGYSGRGEPLFAVDANGVTNAFTYDGRGRLLSKSVAANAVTSLAYDATGNVVKTTLPDGSFLNFQYDAAHHLTSISNVLGEAVVYALDLEGNITNQTIRDVAGTFANTKRKTYDTLKRALQDIGAAGQTTTYTYDNNGNRLSVSDGLTNITITSFDQLNRAVTITDPLGNVTQLSYDALDHLTHVVDPRTLRTIYTYDGFGRLIQERSPDKGTTVYGLDAAGNRVKETDARGVVTLREFDAMNRVTAEAYPGSPGENIAYSYDATDDGNFGMGRLTGYSDESGQTVMVYDERGNLLARKRRIDSNNYVTAYQYDLADRIAKLTYSAGDAVAYDRDSQGRIASVRLERPVSTSQILATNIAYLPFGPLKELRYGNNVLRRMFFDQNYRLTNIVTSGAEAIQNLAMSYDAANDIVSISDQLVPAFDQTFAYNANQHLTQATGIYGAIEYGYDSGGNRTSKTSGDVVENYSYKSAGNALQSVTSSDGVRAFAYMPNGNMTVQSNSVTLSSSQLAYNHRNRYAALTNGATVAHYRFNAFGERILKDVNGIVTHFHYDQQHHLIAETTPEGIRLRKYVWLDDLPLVQVEGDDSVFYIHFDHLSTPQKITDATQAVRWERHQQPFGEEVAPIALGHFGLNSNGLFTMEVRSLPGVTYIVQATTNVVDGPWVSVATNNVSAVFKDSLLVDNYKRFYRVSFGEPSRIASSLIIHNLRFPGQYFDSESGLFYNLLRDYDPSEGKYIQCDPAGIAATTGANRNLFSYAIQNPLAFADALGLDVIIIIGGRTYSPTGRSISGNIFVQSDITPSTFSGFTLENAHAGETGDKSPIPPGTYYAHMRYDHEPHRIQLEDVDGYSNIQIHQGNFPSDFKGCFGVGMEHSTDRLQDSRKALEQINRIIDEDATGNIEVIVGRIEHF